MSTNTTKHLNFVSEPMGSKRVNALAGIGDVLAKRLERKGFDQADKVFGQFLLLEKNEEKFTKWLMETVNANTKQASECYFCLKEWCTQFS